MSLFLTVIVPAYNIEGYIGACLDSLASQWSDDVEILVVDDGSTDKTADIVSSFVARCPGMRLIRQENRGLSGARNRGIAAARGEYILFVDGDDLVASGMFAALREALADGVDVLQFDFLQFRDGTVSEAPCPRPSRSVGTGRSFFSRLVRENAYCAMVWTRAVRTDFLRTKELWFAEGLLHEDEEWTPRVFLHAERVLYLPGTLYYYRVDRPDSIITSFGAGGLREERCRSLLSIVDGLRALAEGVGREDPFFEAAMAVASRILVNLCCAVGERGDGPQCRRYGAAIDERWDGLLPWIRTLKRWRFLCLLKPFVGVRNFLRMYRVRALLRCLGGLGR
jgi:heptose III glucuronosyltransferase